MDSRWKWETPLKWCFYLERCMLYKKSLEWWSKWEKLCTWKWKWSRVLLFTIPWTIAHQAPLSMGFSRQECWSGLPFPSSGDLPGPGIKPPSPALQADASPSEPPGKSLLYTWDSWKSVRVVFPMSSYWIILGLLLEFSDLHFLYLLIINRDPNLIFLLHGLMTQSNNYEIIVTSKVYEKKPSTVAQSTGFRDTPEFIHILCDLPREITLAIFINLTKF